jgi:hypothetical protein
VILCSDFFMVHAAIEYKIAAGRASFARRKAHLRAHRRGSMAALPSAAADVVGRQTVASVGEALFGEQN